MATYIGKRIVPVHCGKWEKNRSYEMLSIVLDEISGDSYIARRMVPAGTDISDTYYWMLHSLFSQQIKDMSDQLAATEERISEDNRSTRDHVDESLQETTRDLTERVTNAQTAMTQQKASFDATAQQLNTRMDAVLAAGTGAGDTEILDARVDADGNTHGSLGDAVRSGYSSLKNAINEKLNPLIGLVWHAGAYVDLAGNIVHDQQIYACSDYVLCRPGDEIKVACATKHTGMSGIAFYTIDHLFLSGIYNDVEDYTEKTVIVPAKAAFCRLSAHAARVNEAYIRWEKSVLPDWLSDFYTQYSDNRLLRLETLNGMYWTVGYINRNGSVSSADSSRFHSDFIPCTPGDDLTYAGESNHVNVSVVSFYDRSGKFVSGLQNTGEKGEELTTTVPEGCWFIRISTDRSVIHKSFAKVSSASISRNLMGLQEELEALKAIAAEVDIEPWKYQSGYRYEDGAYLSSNGVEYRSAGRMATGYILCPEGSNIRFMAETNHEHVAALSFFDIDRNFISSVYNIGDMDVEYEVTAPEGSWFVRSSADKYHQHYVYIEDRDWY